MLDNTIPCLIMRGGTSRGPFLRLSDLPKERDQLAEVLIQVMGSGHELQLDGIGGGNSLTSKVAMVGISDDPRADVDYLFAQVGIQDKSVDFSPNCGNMLAGVAPFAIEMGLVPAQEGRTQVRILNLNTNKIIIANVETHEGKVVYSGNTLISGTSSPGSPIELTFLEVEGAKTGALFPTGNRVDLIDGVKVTCIDAATPTLMIGALSMGKTGYESPAELDADLEFMEKLESIRLKAGELMGLGDVSKQVIPKPILLAKPELNASIAARYFVPNRCHKAIAVTGSIAISTALCHEGTLAREIAQLKTQPSQIKIEHPSGSIDLSIQWDGNKLNAVSLIRTAKKILSGCIFVN